MYIHVQRKHVQSCLIYIKDCTFLEQVTHYIQSLTIFSVLEFQKQVPGIFAVYGGLEIQVGTVYIHKFTRDKL